MDGVCGNSECSPWASSSDWHYFPTAQGQGYYDEGAGVFYAKENYPELQYKQQQYSIPKGGNAWVGFSGKRE